MTTPIEPSVAMNANASGMPPKFAATPENVVIIERIHRGVPSRSAAYAIARPMSAAEQRGDEADLDARLERVDVRVVEEQPHVVERVAARRRS